MTDLIADRSDAVWSSLAAVGPYVHEGRLKALAVDAPARIGAYPAIPTLAELGVASPQASFVFAIVTPAGTPAPIREMVSACSGRC